MGKKNGLKNWSALAIVFLAPLIFVVLFASCGGGDDDDTSTDDDAFNDDDNDSQTAPYPISGYWMYGRSSEGEWQTVLERIHNLGADTVIQFGPRPVRKTPEELESDPLFSLCEHDGQSCYQASLNGLKAEHADNSIRYAYTYQTYENFGSSVLVCPPVEERVEIGEHVFWQLLIPASDPSDRTCDFKIGLAYDLVLMSGRKQSDSVKDLLAQTQEMGMQVYVGMPAAPPDPQYPWEVWSEAKPMFLELTKRILDDYAERYAETNSFVGVYQSFELPAHAETIQSVLDLYRDQHALVRSILPDKKILVSPYWDARKKYDGVSPDSVKAGIKLIARADVDIIAPQDGRGSGKVGLFWQYELDDPVDPRLEPAVGQVTYGEAYYANTIDFYVAAREAVDELASKDGIHVELWANIEAFEPGAGEPCASFDWIQRTTKERLDQAVTFHGALAGKLISFMWDGLYECEAGQGTPLGEELEADFKRPIVSQAFRSDSGKASGIMLRGYHISEGSVHIAYYDKSGDQQNLTIPVTDGVVEPDFGANNLLYPDSLEQVWIPFSWEDVAKSSWLHINVESSNGTSYHGYSLKYN